MNSWKL